MRNSEESGKDLDDGSDISQEPSTQALTVITVVSCYCHCLHQPIAQLYMAVSQRPLRKLCIQERDNALFKDSKMFIILGVAHC